MNTTFSEIITTGMNNPDCSFWVGMSLGSWTTIRLFFVVILVYFVARMINVTVYEPFVGWLDRIIKRKKKVTA